MTATDISSRSELLYKIENNITEEVRQMNKVIKILMDRDGLTYEQAKEEFKATQEEILESIADGYDDVEDILLCNLGLEMDYIFDFI